MTTKPTGRLDTIEDNVKVVIVGVIVVASLASSFTHMHDWTMRELPDTQNWFGWANACISELLPIGAFLVLRRRMRDNRPWVGAAAVFFAGMLLSLGAQIAAVGPDTSLSGKFLAALPVLAFLLLSKLILSDLDAKRKQTATQAEAEAQAEADRKRQAEAMRKLISEAEVNRKRAAQAEAEAEAARQAEAEARQQAEAEAARATAAAEARAEAEAQAEAEATRKAEAEAEAAQLKRRLDALMAADRKRKQPEAEATGSGSRPEADRKRGPEVTSAPVRKLEAVPVLRIPLPEAEVPEVEGASRDTVARVLAARKAHPSATQAELKTITGISERTIRKVINGLPANGHNHHLEEATA